MIDQIQQFFKELGTMNLLAQEHGVSRPARRRIPSSVCRNSITGF